MKNLITLLFLILLLITSISCKKEIRVGCESNCMIFEGTVYDPTNEEYLVSDVELYFHSSSISLSPDELLYKTESNENGAYYISIDGEPYKYDYGYFEVVANKEGYLSDNVHGRKIYYSIDSSMYDVPQIANLELRPKAEIKFHLLTNNPKSNGDFNYTFQYSDVIHRYGRVQNTLLSENSFVHEVGGDQYVIYTYKYMDDEINVRDSIYIKRGERGVVEIEAY